MNQQIENVNYRWLTEPTGDPFVDAGGYALEEFAKRYPDKDILELIEEVSKIYVNRWDANIYNFFLNSKITQPAFKGGRKIEETMKYFRELIEGKETVGKGICRITGQKTELFPAGRNNSILSGSGTFVNFHNTFEAGIMVSKEVLIRNHFVPLACMSLQGRIALIHSNDNKLTAFFAATNCSENLHALAINASEGILNSKYRAPTTALFRFIDKVFGDSEREYEIRNYSLLLYHFTNFSTSPDVKIYTLPATLFRFYTLTQRGEYKEDWNRFVEAYYRNSEYKGAKYNESTRNFDFEKKDKIENINCVEYQTWFNRIYECLLNEESILPYIRNWSEKHDFNIEIVKKYLTLIRNMKQEAQKKLLQLADFVIEIEGKDRIGKCIQQIKNAKTSSALSRFLINKVLPKNMELKNPPIITVEEYCLYLFPEDVYWRDVRDVFLIAIYQRLHEKGIYLNAEDIDDDDNINE